MPLFALASEPFSADVDLVNYFLQFRFCRSIALVVPGSMLIAYHSLGCFMLLHGMLRAEA